MNTGREGKRQLTRPRSCSTGLVSCLGFPNAAPLLGGQPTGETGEAARGSDHPMARCNNGQWVPSVGGSNRPYCVGAADLHGYFRIAAGLAEWNGEQGGPDLFLKFGTLEVEREFEPGTFAGKIFPQLAFGFRQEELSSESRISSSGTRLGRSCCQRIATRKASSLATRVSVPTGDSIFL